MVDVYQQQHDGHIGNHTRVRIEQNIPFDDTEVHILQSYKFMNHEDKSEVNLFACEALSLLTWLRQNEDVLKDMAAKEEKMNEQEETPLDPEIEKRFTYHAPKGDQPFRYERIRATAKDFAYLLKKTCPASRELSLALTHLEEATMFANASIARNE